MKIKMGMKGTRRPSDTKFSIIKYKGETIKALVNLLVLQMDIDSLDDVQQCVESHLNSISENESNSEEVGDDHD